MDHQTHILIVDDEKGLRIGTQRLLELEGFIVEAAENGLEGIRLGTEKDFDLAIIDLKMPDVDGLEVLQKIKKARPNTVCFIATAFASYDTAIEATRLGAYSYIPKPFTTEELIYLLNRGYDHRKLLLESARLKKEREENLFVLASEKSRLKTILETINDGVLVINKSGEVVYFNHSVIKLIGLDELVIGENIQNKLPVEIRKLTNEYFNSQTPLLGSKSIQFELKNKNSHFIESSCSPVINVDKSFAGVVLVLNDISEFKRIELIKNQFVSMVAHELKAPISAVQGFLQLILQEKIDITEEQKKDYLNRSSNRLNGLSDLVNDLLDISRMETSTKLREIKELKLEDIIDSTVSFMELEWKKKGILVSQNFDNDLPLIKGDVNEVTRLITNILSNAIKYNRDQGKIDISVIKSSNYLICKISDTGIGLKEEEKNKLFNQFFRAKNKHTQNISGTGLGLSIAKRIVESYHGKISVESEYEVGTSVIIYLPI